MNVDIPFYLEYATKYPGNILELACGMGRVSIILEFALTFMEQSAATPGLFYSVLKAATGSFLAAIRAGIAPPTNVSRMLITINPAACIGFNLATFLSSVKL